jgi:DHA2 family multidrug resistance protein
MSEPAPEPNRFTVTASLMLVTLMNSLDSTIANVALPHIQGSLSAASDEVVWVLTSYIVATAIVTPVSGWFGNRFGFKAVLVTCAAGFTVASGLCGMATSLPELVLFRFLQGAFGAAILPLGQVVLLNVYPPERHAQAISLWSMGAILGPLMGPVLGGYLTETFSWHWCFLINVPIGAVAVVGLFVSMPATRQPSRRFDSLGFVSLVAAAGALQLLLDRGPGQDWFASLEIWTYLIVTLVALWVFVAHSLTTPAPFINPAIFADRNLVAGLLVMVVGTLATFGSLALTPIVTQGLMGYPVLLSGLVNTPRGFSMLIVMLITPKLMSVFDTRLLMAVGIVCTVISQWQMAHFDLSMGVEPVIVASLWQGVGNTLIFVPLSTTCFVTLAPHLRAEAAALMNMLRSVAASAGISMLQALAVRNTQSIHASVAAHAVPSDPVVSWSLDPLFWPGSAGGAARLDAEITREAAMAAYLLDFRLMLVLTLCCIPFMLLLRGGRGSKPDLSQALAD